MAKRNTGEWVSILNEAGVPCGPIYSIDQVFDDAQVKHLGIAQQLPDDGMHLVAQPVTLSRTPSRMAARPPLAGEQTFEVLKEFGFSEQEIASLQESKVV
jgi:crotonobetainyl-CoA:carnitine CoA-transferase CaiB-like acyl-CoA transferase